MANTFFGFNTALNDHSERLGSSPEDIEGLEAEEEYDALNDETFGALGSELEDWEEQHEQLAEIAESSKHDISSSIISSIIGDSRDLEIDFLGGFNEDEASLESREKSVWAYNSNDSKNGEKDNFLGQQNKFIGNNSGNDVRKNTSNVGPQPLFTAVQQQHRAPVAQHQLPKLRTVEELERMLINQSKPTGNSGNIQPNQQQQYQHGYKEIPMPPRYPPGFQPMVMPQHPAPPVWPYQHHVPPGLMRMMGPPPRVPPPHMMGPPPPPGFMYHHHPHHHNNAFPMNYPNYNYPPPPRNGNPNIVNRGPQYQKARYEQHRQKMEHHGSGDMKDEYSGLMDNKEKQWLLNIQLLQVNTGTPYFDDYYYTVFKERQAKNNKENLSQNANNNNQRYQQHQQYHNGGRYQRDGNLGHHRGPNDNRQEQQQPLKQKIYTPLQFENSLGKLQFGSITAPRKIIDMDIINLDKDSDSPSSARDSRKTKQLLLELEAVYSLMLKAEDLKNPLAISNTEKLKELKQKQRLREIEAAPTPEQKQEVLKLLQQESLAVVENQQDVLSKIVTALLQDDKLSNFMSVRKGKMLLLRLLPHLPTDVYSAPLLDMWIKILLSIPLVSRRDTAGDNILPRFHIHFKRFVNVCELDKLLELTANLVETVRQENVRSTPLSHQSKSPLHFILSNKFGVSALGTLLMRVELIADACTQKQLSDWSNFLSHLSEAIVAVGSSVTVPLEPVMTHFLCKHLARFSNISSDKKKLLEKVFAATE